GPAHDIHLVDKASFAGWAKRQNAARRALLEAARFEGKSAFQYLILPTGQGQDWDVVSTVANAAELSPWCLAKLAEALPEGTYRLADGDPGPATLGWLLGQHRLNDYRSQVDD